MEDPSGSVPPHFSFAKMSLRDGLHLSWFVQSLDAAIRGNHEDLWTSLQHVTFLQGVGLVLAIKRGKKALVQFGRASRLKQACLHFPWQFEVLSHWPATTLTGSGWVLLPWHYHVQYFIQQKSFPRMLGNKTLCPSTLALFKYSCRIAFRYIPFAFQIRQASPATGNMNAPADLHRQKNIKHFGHTFQRDAQQLWCDL